MTAGRATTRERPAAWELSARAPAGPGSTAPQAAPAPTMEERYEEITRRMLQQHGVKVRRWRKRMSGIRQRIGERLVQSQQSTATLTTLVSSSARFNAPVIRSFAFPCAMLTTSAWNFSAGK